MSEETLQKQITELNKKITDFIASFGSRRGPEGIRGLPGADGRPGENSTVAGPVGPAAKILIGTVVAAENASASVVEQADGVHVLSLGLPRGLRGERGEPGVSNIPGATGARGEKGDQGAKGDVGAASTVVGPPGPSIPGKNGLDARVAIGRVSVSDQPSASVRVVDGVSYIDLSIVRGEKGESTPGPPGRDGVSAVGTPGRDGSVGPQGRPGNIDAAVHNAVTAVETRFAELRAEILAEVASVLDASAK